jgi:hypothetical protein
MLDLGFSDLGLDLHVCDFGVKTTRLGEDFIGVAVRCRLRRYVYAYNQWRSFKENHGRARLKKEHRNFVLDQTTSLEISHYLNFLFSFVIDQQYIY